MYHAQNVDSAYLSLSNKFFSRSELTRYISKFAMTVENTIDIRGSYDGDNSSSRESPVKKRLELVHRFDLDIVTVLMANPEGDWSPNILEIIGRNKDVLAITMTQGDDINIEISKIHGIILPGASDSYSALPKPFNLMILMILRLLLLKLCIVSL